MDLRFLLLQVSDSFFDLRFDSQRVLTKQHLDSLLAILNVAALVVDHDLVVSLLPLCAVVD